MMSFGSLLRAATAALLAVFAAGGCTLDKSAPSGWQGGDNVRTAMIPATAAPMPTDKSPPTP